MKGDQANEGIPLSYAGESHGAPTPGHGGAEGGGHDASGDKPHAMGGSNRFDPVKTVQDAGYRLSLGVLGVGA